MSLLLREDLKKKLAYNFKNVKDDPNTASNQAITPKWILNMLKTIGGFTEGFTMDPFKING